MATPSEFQRLSSNSFTVISACFKMDCKVFGLILRCIGTQGYRVVGQFETSGARVVPTRSISSQSSRCGLRTIRAPVKLSHYRMQRILDIMPVRTGLTDKLKAQPFQGAADFIAGKIARQFHAGWRDKTGSSTKCRRMGQCRHSSSASNRHWIKSRIIAINSSRFSPCVAISGSWQMATSASSSRSI